MEAADVVAVLDSMTERLERGWTQGFFARRADGGYCSSQDPLATSWCLEGARRAVSSSLELGAAVSLVLGSVIPASMLGPHEAADRFSDTVERIAWNDEPGRTQAEVLAKVAEARLLVTAS